MMKTLRKNMKKTVWMMSAAVLCASLTACDFSKLPEQSSAEPARTTEPETAIIPENTLEHPGWSYWVDHEAAKAIFYETDLGAAMEVEQAGEASYQTSILYGPFALEQGKEYHIEFFYETTGQVNCEMAVITEEAPYTIYTKTEMPSSGKQREHISFDFTASDTVKPVYAHFYLGDANASTPYKVELQEFSFTVKS